MKAGDTLKLKDKKSGKTLKLTKKEDNSDYIYKRNKKSKLA